MHALDQVAFHTMKRFLAGTIVLSISLMSSAVSTCEISCLFDENHCADSSAMGGRLRSVKIDEMTKQSQDATQAGIPPDSDGIFMQTDSVCNDKLCKNVSTAALLPNRTQLKSIQWVAVSVITSAKLHTGRCVVHKSASPPQKFARLNTLSVTLRI